MADRPLTSPLPADLPEDWTSGQIVAPSGADVGLSQQHGYNYLMEQVNAVQRAANAINEGFDTISGKRTCRVTVGTSTAGWTQAECDYLCDGTDDQAELNAAIAEVLAKGGGEIAVLGGEYHLSEAWSITSESGEDMSLAFSGEPGATVLNLSGDSFSSMAPSLQFSGITFHGGNELVKIAYQNVSVSFKNCRFLNVALSLEAFADKTSILFSGNEMKIFGLSGQVTDPALYADSALNSDSTLLVVDNSFYVETDLSMFTSIVTVNSGPVLSENILPAAICANNTVILDSSAAESGLEVGGCICVNNSTTNAWIQAQGNYACAGNFIQNGYISSLGSGNISRNMIENGQISAYGFVNIVGNYIAAPADSDAITVIKPGPDWDEGQTPAITGNYIKSGHIGIHLSARDDPANGSGYALVSGNKIWGCETPIQIENNWSRCMVTDNLFPAGSSVVDYGVNNIVRLNSDDPGSGSGGGTAGVASFNGRTGAVAPQSGDYTATMVGAIPADTVQAIQVVTQAEYDALGTKDAATLYLIKE